MFYVLSIAIKDYQFLACREHVFMQQSVLVEHITEYVQH